MIVSYNWLNELIKINVSPEKLSEEMSLYSCEVETFNKMVNATNLCVGYVEECLPHENSDHLHVCKVNIGSSVEQIVCGAPNVRTGVKVIVALPGATLPGGKIKKSAIRGVESNGMLCSLQELGIENKYVPLEFQNGIYLLDDNAEVGMDALKYLCFDDYLIELSLTPNRLDLMSMLGVAHDMKAMYHGEINYPKCDIHEMEKETKDEIAVEIKTPECLAYYARIVKDVVIKDSPQFMKARLIASGIRPINNVVDITNYVLMLFGQPLHSFDQDKLGKKIIIRKANLDEKLVTLDDIERTLDVNDIVISDDLDNNRSVCLAGVMGGKSTEVTLDTKNIVLESAVFDSLTVRKTSSRVGLRSESSVRFERGVDVNNSLNAINYACYLLEKYADGKVLKGYVHDGIDKIEDTVIDIDDVYVKSLLGIEIPNSKIKEILESLDFRVEELGSTLKVYVPNRRMDVKIKQDLVEEIGRIYGYNKLDETLPLMNVEGELTKPQKIRRTISNTLVGIGMSEAVTYSLVNKNLSNEFKVLYDDRLEPITLLHPMTDEHSILRRSIVPSLLDVVAYNNARKIYNLELFEQAKGYGLINGEPVEYDLVAGALQAPNGFVSWTNKNDVIDFYYTKGVLEEIFTKLSLDVKFEKLQQPCPELHPGRSAQIVYNNHLIGYVGEVHPSLVKKLDIVRTFVFELKLEEIYKKKDDIVLFSNISRVPSVERDLALVMDKEQAVGEVINTIYSTDKKMIKEVKVFDLYEGEHIEDGKKSVAVRIVLEGDETLTDDIINAKIKKILNTLAYMYKIEIRK